MLLKDFAEYSFEDATEIFADLKSRLKDQKVAHEFIKGNDWQDGAGWVGPQFETGGEIQKILKKEVERDFTPKGTIRSIVRRKVRGVVGRMPGWQISSRNAPSDPEADPSPDETALIKEAQKILNEFWKNSRLHFTLKSHVRDFEALGHSPLRLYFVKSTIDENTDTIEKAVKRIHLFKEKPETACVVMNPETLQKASFMRYEKNGFVYIEMCYIDENGDTVYKRLSKENTKDFTSRNFSTSLDKYNKGKESDDGEPIAMPLNGQLLIFELSGDPLVSKAMCAQQKLENKGYSMLSHNLDEDGFRKKKILNGMPPGEFKTSPEGKQIFVANESEVKISAGSVEYISGKPVIERDKEGNIKQGYTTPAIHESQPIDVKTYTESIRVAKEAQLEEGDQLHVAIAGDATASGVSREQARDDYRGSLEDSKSLLDDEMSNVSEAVLSVVAYLMDDSGRYDDLQVSFSCKLNVGPRTVEERTVAREESKEGFRSRESAMEELNIEDPDAMKVKIKQEEAENPPEPEPKPAPAPKPKPAPAT